MKTIKVTDEQARLIAISISACIREETKDMVIAESKGYKTTCYKTRLTELAMLKESINKQID